MKNKALFLYVLLMFLLIGITPLFSAEGQAAYLPLAIILAGVVAIVLQKTVHRGKFLDMGFRLNRNAFIGVGIGLLFTAAAVFVVAGLPYLLGMAEFSLNQESAVVAAGVPEVVAVPIILIVVGAIGFVCCLFGEELAFRGYILPKLEDSYGTVRAIVLCSVIFGLWHLPAYFSIYTGGAGESGLGSIGMMLVAHGISVVPICILYVTTRELYGVSLYHALINVFQYSIVRNPELGDAAKDAVYDMTISNETATAVIGWGWHLVAIFLMLGLCKIAKKWTLTTGKREEVTGPKFG